MKEKIQKIEMNNLLSHFKNKNSNSSKKIDEKEPSLNKKREFIKRIGLGLSIIICGSVLVFLNDMKNINQESQKEMVFSDINIMLEKRGSQHIENMTDSFVNVYNYYDLKNKENISLVTMLLLWGQLQQAAMDTNNTDSIYYFYNHDYNKEPNKEFMKNNKQDYFASKTYKRNLEIQKKYFNELMSLMPRVEETKEKNLQNLSFIGDLIIRPIIKDGDEYIWNKVLWNAYETHITIENAEKMNMLISDENFDLAKIMELNDSEYQKYWEENFAKKYNLGNEVPDYFKIITGKFIRDENEKSKKREEVMKFYMSYKNK